MINLINMKKIQDENSDTKESPLVHNKKLLRLPYYKLEELKKQEEKKSKHGHKLKKKEEHVQLVHIPQNPHHPHQRETKSVVKGKKIILKKIKEEPETVDELELYRQLICDKKPNGDNPSLQMNENYGDKLKNLKYSMTKVKVKKLRLSKKQRRLQDPENTLASFMTKEDSIVLSRKSSNLKGSFVNNKQQPITTNNTNEKNESTNTLNNVNTINTSNQQTNNNTTNFNSANNSDLKILGKKKKRLTKYKKAIYKSRFEKQQFIYSKIFSKEEDIKDGLDDMKETCKEEIDKIPQGANYIPKIQPSNSNIPPNNGNSVMYNYYNGTQNSSISNNWNLYNYGISQPYQYGPSYPYSYNPLYPYHYQYPVTGASNFIMPKNKFDLYRMNPYLYPGYPTGFVCNNFIQYNYNNLPHSGNKRQWNKIEKDYPKKRENDSKPTAGFIFENIKTEDDNTKPEVSKEEFANYLKTTYDLDIDITKLNGKELNDFLKEHKDLKRVNLNHLKKLFPSNFLDQYMKTYEGIHPLPSLNKKIIRDYVDQVLDSALDKKFSDFIVKIRELYYKKKQANPLKAKKRFVVGMREIEKFIRLDEAKCLFVVPNIEKSEGKNSLDERLVAIFKQCESRGVPVYFGLNKFKLGQAARKKHSCVSMLAFINVEGFEREFREILEYAEDFRRKFYIKNYESKELFKDNKFINMSNFEKYTQII